MQKVKVHLHLKRQLTRFIARRVVSLMLLGLTFGCVSIAKAEDKPAESMPFIVFSNKKTNNHYIPSGWMGDWKDFKISDSKENPYEGDTCLRWVYSAKGSQGEYWAGCYWQHPLNNWGNKEGGYNLSQAKKLSFWAKGEKGGEVVTFLMGGILLGTVSSDTDAAKIEDIVLSENWQEYVIDLRERNLKNIITGFGFIVSKGKNPEGCTFYLDEIIYQETTEGIEEVKNSTVSLPQTEEIDSPDLFRESIEEANQQIIKAKGFKSLSQESEDCLYSSLSILKKCYDNRYDVSPEGWIYNRHHLFNCLKALVYASIEPDQEELDNPIFLEAEKMCYNLAKDIKLPKELRGTAYNTCALLSAQRANVQRVLEIFYDMMREYPEDSSQIGHAFLDIGECSEEMDSKIRQKQRAAGNKYPETTDYEKQALDIYELLSKLISDSSISAEARKNKANIHLKNGEFDQAIMEYEAIVSMEAVPEHWKAYSRDYIGYFYTLKGDYKKALEWFQSIIDEHPKLKGWHALALYKKAKVHTQLGKKADAEVDYKMVINKHPNSPWAETSKIKLKELYDEE